MGPYNIWNIIHLTPKSIPSEELYEIHKVVIYVISKNMASLVQSGMYGVTTTDDIKSNGFYVTKFISEAYTLQNNTQIDGHVISAGELVVKAKYICSIKENTNWYWKQKPLQQNIIVPTRTIIHPRLDVIIIRYVQYIPKNVCDMIQEKNLYKDILFV